MRPLSCLLAIFIIISATGIAYSPTLGNDFCLDDAVIFQASYPHNLSESGYLFTTSVSMRLGGYYRPLTFISFIIDFTLWKKRPLGYHLTNIMLAAATAVVLFFVARYFVAPYYALLAAMIFAVWPAHSEAVIGIFNRSQILSTLAMLGAVLCFIKAFEQQQRYLLYLAAIITFVGCLCKESSLVTPALSVLLLLWYRPSGRQRMFLVMGILWQGVACGAYLVLRYYAIGTLGVPLVDSFVAGQPVVTRYFNSMWILHLYVKKTLWPMGLSCDYPLAAISLHWSGFLYPLLLTAAIYFFIKGSSGSRIISLCFLWFVVALLPVLHLVAIQIAFAERLLYPATPAFALALAFVISKWQVHNHKLAIFAVIVVLTAATVMTIVRSTHWRNNHTLWQQVLITTPNSYRAQIHMGAHWARKALTGDSNVGDSYQQAFSHYEQALSFNPNRNNILIIHYNMAILKLNRGNIEGAVQHLQHLLQLYPKYDSAWRLLGNIAYRQQKWQLALDCYQRVQRKNRWDTSYSVIESRIQRCLLKIR